MLKRIFKTIFILALCFGIIESTYAAVSTSVSEGSAFVTKAEFRALVNEASTRIETLELHSDKKITTMVDDFLARYNNIWYPQKQTLTSNTEMELIPASGSSGTFIISDKKTCIDQVTKSGMIIISLYYKAKEDPTTTPAAKSYRWGYTGECDTTVYLDVTGTELYIEFFEELRSSTDAKGNTTYYPSVNRYTYLVGTALGAKNKTGDSNKSLACVIALSPIEVMIPVCFFVGRDSRISWDAKQTNTFLSPYMDDFSKVCEGNGGLNIIARIADPIVY